MAARVEPISKRPAVKRQAWKDLGAHYKKIRDVHLRQLFAKDPQRGEHFTAEAVGFYLDYSKNRITAETRRCSSGSPKNPVCENELTLCFVARKAKQLGPERD